MCKISKSHFCQKGSSNMFGPGRNLVRFYSKRRVGISNIKAQRASMAVASAAKSKQPTSSANTNLATFIPVAQFPKAPKEVLEKPVEELYASIGKEPPATEVDTVEFEIPKKFSKEYQNSLLNQRDIAMMKQLDIMMNTDDEKLILESQIILGNLYSDRDSFSNFTPEHPLKKSLSGMINLNPHLNDVDDDFLWDLIPPDKLFGSKFFEKEGTFREWEEGLLEEKNKLMDHLKEHEAEISDFLKQFSENKNVVVKKNRRLKLNKSLIKAYKSLKSKDLDIIIDDDSNEIEFEFKKNNKK